MDGLALLEKLNQQNTHTPVIVMSAFGTIENAVEAMKKGAVDFLPKPFSLDHLSVVVEKALEVRKLRDENRELREALGPALSIRKYHRAFARHAGDFRDHHARRAHSRHGAAGRRKRRRQGYDRARHPSALAAPRSPFVKINCTALPENLMESELFGYEKGAFTGANISKPGKFEAADTGTVFLDEIGDVPPAIQVKLLNVLQEREIERLGSNKTCTPTCAWSPRPMSICAPRSNKEPFARIFITA
jgi:DNA-binding NtrC family response regulator